MAIQLAANFLQVFLKLAVIVEAVAQALVLYDDFVCVVDVFAVGVERILERNQNQRRGPLVASSQHPLHPAGWVAVNGQLRDFEGVDDHEPVRQFHGRKLDLRREQAVDYLLLVIPLQPLLDLLLQPGLLGLQMIPASSVRLALARELIEQVLLELAQVAARLLV